MYVMIHLKDKLKQMQTHEHFLQLSLDPGCRTRCSLGVSDINAHPGGLRLRVRSRVCVGWVGGGLL